MLKLVSQRKIKENWKTYKEQVKEAMVSTDGGLAFFKDNTEETLKGIYSRLMNPFSHQMHLWIDDDDEYLLLTHIQVCEITETKTLILFSLTRTKDVDKETIIQRWVDGYPIISTFALQNDCKGITAFTDLDYFVQVAKKLAKLVNKEIIIRYQYYVPL